MHFACSTSPVTWGPWDLPRPDKFVCHVMQPLQRLCQASNVHGLLLNVPFGSFQELCQTWLFPRTMSDLALPKNAWLACRAQQSQARTLMLCLVLDWSVTQLTPWTSAAASLSGTPALCFHMFSCCMQHICDLSAQSSQVKSSQSHSQVMTKDACNAYIA